MAESRNQRIEGASPDQEALLREILAGLGETRIEEIRLEPFDRIGWEEYEEFGVEPTAEEIERNQGVAVVLANPDEADLRTRWETMLLGNAFCELSAKRGLPRVVWVQDHESGSALDVSDSDAPEAASREEIERAVQTAAARAGALLDSLEILEPLDPAPAVTLAVAEAHAFLRHGLMAFLELAGHYGDRYYGSYVAVVDGELEPVWEGGHYRYGGMSRRRADVACCAPYRGGLLYDPGSPPCPGLSRTWDDAYAAFRRNLAATTGRPLEEWLELLASGEHQRTADRFHRLRHEHGLGAANAAAIVDATERNR